MAEDSLGKVFRVHSFGESHGKSVGVSIEGCPPLLDIDLDAIQKELDKRKPGQSKLTTQRKESDIVEIHSGLYEGKTLGSPILMMIHNQDHKGGDYEEIKNLYRPSHADFTYDAKYGCRFPDGGGRSSARITAGWVAAGAIAKQLLQKYSDIEILGYTKKIKDIECRDIDLMNLSFEDVEASLVRCPHKEVSDKMEELILETKAKGDSLGGVIECIVKNVPVGLGEPLFGKLESDLAKACMSIPASKGFEVGCGFDSVDYYGSELNDEFVMNKNHVETLTNNSGGIQGGISNGMPIVFRVGFKPTATIFKTQKTVSKQMKEVEIKPRGRHDVCVIPRAVPIVEAVTAITLCDHFLRNRTILR